MCGLIALLGVKIRCTFGR